jgi:uncharacterized protein (TIGR02996 family)
MTPHEAFLAKIIAAPDDDAPRLEYADWLDENERTEESPCPVCSEYHGDASTPWKGEPGYHWERDVASGRHEGGWTNCKTCNRAGNHVAGVVRQSNGYAARAEFIRVQIRLAPMPTMNEMLTKLKTVRPAEEFEDTLAGILWMGEFDIYDDQEPHDVADDLRVAAVEAIKPLLGPGWTLDGFWSDNDSVGFTIRPTREHSELRKREYEMLAAHVKPPPDYPRPHGGKATGIFSWAGVAAQLQEERGCPLPWMFRRGFVERVRCTAEEWEKHGKTFCKHAPIREVQLTIRLGAIRFVDQQGMVQILSQRYPGIHFNLTPTIAELELMELMDAVERHGNDIINISR